MRTTTKFGAAIAHLADSHHLLTTEALRHAGLSTKQIKQLRDDGVIEHIVRGLHRLAGTRTPLQDIAAATSRHAGAVASHVSALYVHALDIDPPPTPFITLPPGSTSHTSLAVLHRSPLEGVDVTRRNRIPVTTMHRSIVDAAEVLTVETLATVVNEAVSRRLTTISRIIEAADRVEAAPGRIGSGRLRAVLATWTEAIEPDSVAEAAVIRKIRTFGIDAPVTQHEVRDGDGGFVARLDMAWPAQKVGREYQSVKWHGVERIEADEERMLRLEALGWTIEPLYRIHLLPSEIDWLHRLRRQLASVALAS